jgi:hypothetical protein
MTRNRTGKGPGLGNNAIGQTVLGQPRNARSRWKADQLRAVNELDPEIVEGESGEDPFLRCLAVEELNRQKPLIHQTLRSAALRCW